MPRPELRALNAQLEQRVAQRTVELTAANERLRELDVLKSNLIDEVSHELRNPLAAMSTQVYLLERQPERSENHLAALSSQMTKLRESCRGYSRCVASGVRRRPC